MGEEGSGGGSGGGERWRGREMKGRVGEEEGVRKIRRVKWVINASVKK